MRWTLAVAVAAVAALGRGPTAQSLLLQREAQSALFTLAATPDELEHTWQQYEALVLSTTRSTPLVLFFEGDGSAAACAKVDEDDDESEAEETEGDARADEGEASAAAQACRAAHAERRDLLLAAMATVARAYEASGLQIVRVPAQLLPRMARYHRVATTTPSLLWLAPRSARGFQRYPHPETNALDLSSPTTLLASAAPRSQHTGAAADGDDQRPQDALAAIAGEFVRQWFVKSGLAPASSARTGVVPSAAASRSSSSSASDELSVMEFVPLLGLAAFLGVVAYDNRALLRRTLAGRFVWFVWSAGVTYAAYSGVFHSLIHRAPLFYFSPHFGLYLFHPSGRRQFVLEGLVSGAWSFCVSLGAFSIVEILPMQRSPVARTDVFWFSVLIIGGACALVHVTFMAKTPWLSA